MKKIITLLVLICTITLTFTSCLWRKYTVLTNRIFDSQKDLVEFIEEYNSKNDGFVYTFILFDFDNDEIIKPYFHSLYGFWTIRSSPLFKDEHYVKRYDKNHSQIFGGKSVFHIEEWSVQIRCSYNTSKEYNFYQNDEISIEYIEKYNFDEIANNQEKMNEMYYSYDEFLYDFADWRSLNEDSFDYEEYYNYMNIYSIQINGENTVTVKIASKSELSEEQINVINNLLLDNIVIINTEG